MSEFVWRFNTLGNGIFCMYRMSTTTAGVCFQNEEDNEIANFSFHFCKLFSTGKFVNGKKYSQNLRDLSFVRETKNLPQNASLSGEGKQ